MAPGALDGLLVADFSRVLAGPLCTMTLGDLGADVVKVERGGPGATGDDTRSWGTSYFPALNRNKRSLALDLADPGDRALARELALRADVARRVVPARADGGLGPRARRPAPRAPAAGHLHRHGVRRRATRCPATTCSPRPPPAGCR